MMAIVVLADGTITGKKNAIQGVGYHVYYSDAEGNPFGMSQTDKNAK